MIFAALVLVSAAQAQTAGYPVPQSTTGQQSGQSQDTGQSSGTGQQPSIPPTPVRPDPTQITFGSPDQDVPPAVQNVPPDKSLQNFESYQKYSRQTPPAEHEPDIAFQEFVATALGKKFQ